MKKQLAFLLLLALMTSLLSPALAVSAVLNQRMATRSGPGTQYTEELGTLPQDTSITLIHYVQDKNNVPWGLVEFSRNNQLYRAYTGMKRINVPGGNAPYLAEHPAPASATASTTVYYGPGTRYAARREQLHAGTPLLVIAQENGYLLCEYQQGDRPERGYVPVSATTHAAAPTAAPAVQPPISLPATGGLVLTAQSGDTTLSLQWAGVAGASEYLVLVRDSASQLPIRAQRTAIPAATVPNLPRSRVYSVEIMALAGAQGGDTVLASTTVYHQVP
ncbi:MAG: hypothetical protein GX653_07310 [Clostridiales bacterium]|nr:hypothetical protein [Clostridiales bacterium]